MQHAITRRTAVDHGDIITNEFNGVPGGAAITLKITITQGPVGGVNRGVIAEGAEKVTAVGTATGNTGRILPRAGGIGRISAQCAQRQCNGKMQRTCR